MAKSPRCPRCDGRLFLGSEVRGRRSISYWECSLGCNRQFDLGGRLRIKTGERVRAKVPKLAVVS